MTRLLAPYTIPRLALVLATVVATACAVDDDGRPPTWETAVDTLPNGAVHVVNTPPAEGIEPRWVIEEELRIGAMEGSGGPETFGEIRGIAALDDGRIAVLETQTQEIRIFGPDGAHLVTYGGQGQGPEEMMAAYGLMRDTGGTLLAPDHRNARMVFVDPDSGVVRTAPLRVLRRAFVWRGVTTDDGRVLKPSMSQHDRSNWVRVYDMDMTLIDTLPLQPDPDVDPEDPPSAFVQGSVETTGFRRFFGVPWFPSMQQAIDGTGRFWTTAYGDGSYRIAGWTPGGDTSVVIETRRPPVPVTSAERDSVIEALTERLLEAGNADQDWSKIPDAKPAILGLFADADHRLWARVSTPGDGHTFDVYEADGRYAGTATTPLNLWTPLAPVVRGDHMWLVVTDELDVPYVIRARLSQPHNAPGTG